MGKPKKLSPNKELEKTVDVEELKNWAETGGGSIPATSAKAETEPVVLRYSLDKNGLRALIVALAHMVAGCRLFSQLEPNPREERAIEQIKLHAGRHAAVLQANREPDTEKLSKTMIAAQRLLDGFTADYDRLLGGAFGRFDEILKEVEGMFPQLLRDKEKMDELARLQQEFSVVMEDETSTPAQRITAYKEVRKHLSMLENIARAVTKKRQRNEAERSARIATADDILGAIDLL